MIQYEDKDGTIVTIDHCFCYMDNPRTYCRRCLTLCQYYDMYAKKEGFGSWNHFCAERKGNGNHDWLKKKLKSEYKILTGQKEKT